MQFPYDMTQPPLSITLDGHQLTYTIAGQPEAPPVMLVHGWLSHRGVWRQTLAALQDKYYCVAVDLPSFGDSDKPATADYRIPAQGNRILQLADAFGWERFTLIGHSMGGQIALCIASLLVPQRITHLISVAGVVSARLCPYVENVTNKWIALWRMFPQMSAVIRRLSRYRSIVCSEFSGYRRWFYRMDAVPFEEWAIDRDMAFQPHGEQAAYRAGQAIHALDLTSQLSRITAPALAIFGQQDGVVPVSDGYLVKQHVPHSRLVLIDECGHFPMYEKPQPYLEAMQAFLAGTV
jgi:abhydrolase domain-containing protein 6